MNIFKMIFYHFCMHAHLNVNMRLKVLRARSHCKEQPMSYLLGIRVAIIQLIENQSCSDTTCCELNIVLVLLVVLKRQLIIQKEN